jgi:hypothetical protein
MLAGSFLPASFESKLHCVGSLAVLNQVYVEPGWNISFAVGQDIQRQGAIMPAASEPGIFCEVSLAETFSKCDVIRVGNNLGNHIDIRRAADWSGGSSLMSRPRVTPPTNIISSRKGASLGRPAWSVASSPPQLSVQVVCNGPPKYRGQLSRR